ncbi:amidase [Pseudomonas tohonis]|uniref:amidase n=1 Tax=Pseudomonas tohonis TaxID=2725477 RepID=UPI00255B50FC|nr:amidase family protein [Pseudomonas tohonis]
MKAAEYAALDALDLAALIASRDVTPEEVRAFALKAFEALNPSLNALVEHWDDEPLPPSGPLRGVPFLIKDVGVAMAGRRNELGSRLAQGLVAPGDSQLMRRFREAGLLTLGRTTVPELAASTATESLATGPTRNPWNPRYGAGGSSGGAAAAVAAGLVPVAHATDGGGSIRVPAAVTGLFGLKPSRGRVSMGPGLDEVWSGLAMQGVLSRTVRDSAALLDAIQGHAPGDPYRIAAPERSFLAEVAREPGRLRIGLLVHPLSGARSAASMVTAVEGVARQLQEMGHAVEAVQPDIGLDWDTFVELNARFWAANTADWIDALAAQTGRPIDGSTLEPASLALYELGRGLSAIDLLGAMHWRNTVARHMGAFFTRHDLLLSPTLAEQPPLIGEYNRGQENLDGRGWMHRVFQQSPFTALANVSGGPSMSMPLAHDAASGLPIGIQLSADWGQEGMLLRLAGQLERALPWSARTPELWSGTLD